MSASVVVQSPVDATSFQPHSDLPRKLSMALNVRVLATLVCAGLTMVYLRGPRGPPHRWSNRRLR